MFRLTIIFIILIHSLPSPRAFSDDDIPDLVILDLEGLIGEDQQGPYAKFFQHLVNEGHLKSWVVAPIRRARRMFWNKKAHCLGPTSMQHFHEFDLDETDYTISTAFNEASGYLYRSTQYMTNLTKDMPTIGTVGSGNLYGIQKDTYKAISIRNYFRLLTLVQKNRLDAAYIIYPDIINIPKAAALTRKMTSARTLVWTGKEQIICHKDAPVNIAKISAFIAQSHKNGSLSTLLGNAYNVPTIGPSFLNQ
ncbi:hypothetical protein QGN29_08030 [Temperatibacter marinus]|uniref:Uncharacterized protein n=1 Tax=Temperatibacter marinus TaxID=1456591 RepID=A0AA52H8J2_9PROT|nr:hypothetical protein [Temperatibacter marinus]WND01507.1 hypothetical protein QGN29_08030 [Temperatibacter marinus]